MSQWPYRAVAKALEVIPRTLIQNCGGNTIRSITQIRAKHAEGSYTFGVNGENGEVTDMKELKVWEPFSVKSQVLKTAIEVREIIMDGWDSYTVAGRCVSDSNSVVEN